MRTVPKLVCLRYIATYVFPDAMIILLKKRGTLLYHMHTYYVLFLLSLVTKRHDTMVRRNPGHSESLCTLRNATMRAGFSALLP